SERLKGILKEFEGRWDKLAEALKKLVQEARSGRQEDDATGLDPETQAPFFDVLKHEAVGKEKLEGEALDRMCALTVELVEHVQQEIGIVGFWSKAVAREDLRGWMFRTLDDADVVPFERLDAVADKLMELAKANHHRLVRS
ncbi:MAG: restriction endonuclease subunit R, partial [Myxococcales bacterium]|nr:restriction endonuclease subunit R [Myxococcales bacterium]